ncbi:hypothetical protein D9C73_000087 [Collichthys lucidus]|uniref:Uncharacterized protein n=1 Tax=Collichthys lucidus TaxID=240159 RepID=A0A4U5TYP6_COLLU|nr:hypothetical protein D9C73_000087 [Collichthys lucidus]
MKKETKTKTKKTKKKKTKKTKTKKKKTKTKKKKTTTTKKKKTKSKTKKKKTTTTKTKKKKTKTKKKKTNGDGGGKDDDVEMTERERKVEDDVVTKETDENRWREEQQAVEGGELQRQVGGGERERKETKEPGLAAKRKAEEDRSRRGRGKGTAVWHIAVLAQINVFEHHGHLLLTPYELYEPFTPFLGLMTLWSESESDYFHVPYQRVD